MLIDAHCHIDRFPDPSRLARRCETDGITTVAVTNAPSHYELAVPHLAGMQFVKPALGLHPLAVRDNQYELGLFLRLLPQARFVGEIGLDLSTEGVPTKNAQIQVFTSIVEAMAGSTRFVTLHSRGAADEMLDILERFEFHHAVFHWFTGTLRTLERAIEWGCWFSVNPSMVKSHKGMTILSKLPRDRVLTETDGPYVKVGRRPAEPSDVRSVLDYLADFWRMSHTDTEATIVENFQRASEG